MITLKQSGQWYRFFRRWNIVPPRNLCILFWKCLWFPSFFTIAGAVISVCAIMIVIGHVQLVLLFFFGTPLPVGYGVWGILVGAAWIILTGYWILRGIRRAYGLAHVPASWSQSNLVKIPKAAYQGFKERFCPLVEWE